MFATEDPLPEDLLPLSDNEWAEEDVSVTHGS